MSLTCLELINSHIAKEGLKIVGGRGGVDRQILWTHFLESPNVIKFMQQSELIFITGLHIKGNPNILTSTIETLSAGKAAGAVITTGDALERIPAEVCRRADVLEFPLFEIPWQTNLAGIIQSIGTLINSEKSVVQYNEYSIFEAVMFADEDTYSDIQSRMSFYGYDLGARSFVMAAGASELNDETKNLAYRSVKKLCAELGVNFIAVWRRNELVMLISAVKLERINLKYSEFAGQVLETLCSETGIQFNIGLSDITNHVSELRRECDNASLALKVAGIENISGILEYKNLGIYRFLNRINDDGLFLDFYNEALRELIEYDKTHGTGFLDTLEIYINCGKSVSETANKLFIHRNTLKYRLSRIEHILGCSLDDATRVLEIELAFKIKKFSKV